MTIGENNCVFVTQVNKIISVIIELTSKMSGKVSSLVPLTSSKDGGPQPTKLYINSLNHTELISGIAGPR